MSELLMFGLAVLGTIFVMFLIVITIWLFFFKKVNKIRKDSMKEFNKGFDSDFFKKDRSPH